MVRTGVALFLALTSLAAALTGWIVPSHGQHRSDESIVVDRIRSFDGAGQAYRLTYTIDVPPKLFWAFKTDFGAAFLLTNRYILSHRLTSR